MLDTATFSASTMRYTLRAVMGMRVTTTQTKARSSIDVGYNERSISSSFAPSALSARCTKYRRAMRSEYRPKNTNCRANPATMREWPLLTWEGSESPAMTEPANWRAMQRRSLQTKVRTSPTSELTAYSECVCRRRLQVVQCCAACSDSYWVTYSSLWTIYSNTIGEKWRCYGLSKS